MILNGPGISYTEPDIGSEFVPPLPGHSLLIANTMVHVTAWGFVAAVRLPMLGA